MNCYQYIVVISTMTIKVHFVMTELAAEPRPNKGNRSLSLVSQVFSENTSKFFFSEYTTYFKIRIFKMWFFKIVRMHASRRFYLKNLYSIPFNSPTVTYCNVICRYILWFATSMIIGKRYRYYALFFVLSNFWNPTVAGPVFKYIYMLHLQKNYNKHSSCWEKSQL